MIELYDAARLHTRKDPTLPLAVVAVVLTLGGMGGYGWQLQGKLSLASAQAAELQKKLTQAAATPETSPMLLADLQAQAEGMEAQARDAGEDMRSDALSATQWLDRLGNLANAEVSLQKIEIDRTGGARVEGLATGPDALSGFVQAWEKQDQLASVRPRSMEVRQDKTAANLLRFQMRAAPPQVAKP